MNDRIPRRCYVDRLTSAELAIHNAMIEVEKVGAHPLLTDAVDLLGEAKDKVADWVDGPGATSADPVADQVVNTFGTVPYRRS